MASGALVDGLDVRAVRFRGKERLTLSKLSAIEGEKKVKKSGELYNVAKKSYSFSVWVNPSYPSKKKSRTGLFSIITKGGLKPRGLYLHRNKRVSFMHPLEREKNCVATSTRLVPEGTWTHLVGVVDPKKGFVKLYINGDAVAKATFPANSQPNQTYVRPDQFMLGNPGTAASLNIGLSNNAKAAAPEYDDNAFIGMMDELRVYARAITAAEIKQLYRIHSGLAN